MTSTVAERLKEARIAAGYDSASSAARAVGVPVATYLAHENGSRSISPDQGTMYAKKFKVRASWLLLDEGEREPGGRIKRVPVGQEFAPDPDFETTLDEGVFSAGQPYTPKVTGARPEIDVKPGAGTGQSGEMAVLSLASMGTVSGHRVVAEWVFPDSFVRHGLSSDPNGIVMMEVIGDSMRPTLDPGDRVVVDTLQNSFGADGIYVFDDGDGEPRVKRLEKVHFSQPARVRIVSDNKSHSGQEVDLDLIRILGRVTGRMSRL